MSHNDNDSRLRATTTQKPEAAGLRRLQTSGVSPAVRQKGLACGKKHGNTRTHPHHLYLDESTGNRSGQGLPECPSCCYDSVASIVTSGGRELQRRAKLLG